MVEIKRVTDTEIKSQSVQLSNRPDGVDRQVRCNNEVILRMRGYDSEPRAEGIGHNSAAVVRIIDVIVVLDTDACPDSEPNWTQEQIVRDAGNVLLPRIGRRWARQ